MNNQFAYQRAMKAVQAVRQLHDETGAFFDSQGIEPTSNSLAAQELKEFERPESVLTAYSQGFSLIEVAADHLIALTKTVTEPAQTIAPWTTTRVILESSALSCWLLDLNITTRMRVQRSLALRYEGLIQQDKFLRASLLTAEIPAIDKRIEEVETIAESLGFTKLRNKKGKRAGIGQIFPKITDIVQMTLDEEANYRLFSAMTHAHSWAYSQLSFKRVEDASIQGINEAVLMEKHLPVEIVIWLCINAARYFAQPIKYRCEIFGWDSTKLNEILDRVFIQFEIRKNSKFWHTHPAKAS